MLRLICSRSAAACLIASSMLLSDWGSASRPASAATTASCSRLFETASAGSVCRATCLSRAKESRRAASFKRKSSRSKAVLVVPGWIRRKIARSRLIVVRTLWTSSLGSHPGVRLRSTTLCANLSTSRRNPARTDASGLSVRSVLILTLKNFLHSGSLRTRRDHWLVSDGYESTRRAPEQHSFVVFFGEAGKPVQMLLRDDEEICRPIRCHRKSLLGVPATSQAGFTTRTSPPDLSLQPQQVQVCIRSVIAA